MGKYLTQKMLNMAFDEKELGKVLDDFAVAYCLQKGIDLEDVELVVYEDKKRTIVFFRKKSKEIKRYGTDAIQN